MHAYTPPLHAYVPYPLRAYTLLCLEPKSPASHPSLAPLPPARLTPLLAIIPPTRLSPNSNNHTPLTCLLHPPSLLHRALALASCLLHPCCCTEPAPLALCTPIPRPCLLHATAMPLPYLQKKQHTPDKIGIISD
ncbi:hypothetical protein SLEP1_g39574 [Rubroshorea leprosula]|uniref:Uncharacterized protein n=1 Tax=Rubroshorea leprosula TaxID=152421 RepID=A0AAV5L119_9ROSI|nr:hypothetical protein SLEP1_g39574 [Rubroshorea leprosula]